MVAQRRDAEATIRALLKAGLLDGTRRIASGDEVTIPVRPDPALASWATRLSARLVDAPDLERREGRRTPRDEVLDLVRPALGDASLAELVPDKWEQHADVLVLRLPDEIRPHAALVGAAFAQVLGLKSVLDDEGGVAGELREMRHARLVWGDDPVCTHLENGVRYRFDASRIMFSSGNLHERMRAAALPARGETVVDMFAGIGYFTLPLAVHAGAARVHALEKNPVAHQYLVENVALNGVGDIVQPWLGDNREFSHEGIADRVMMGYFPGTRAFLRKAFALLKPEGGTIHYHETAHAEHWKEELTRQVLDAGRACGRVLAIERARVVTAASEASEDQDAGIKIERARVVKTHSPGVVHAVLDVRVRR